MRKKCLYLIIAMVAFFTVFTKLNALTCKYSDGKLTATFDINESKQKVEKAVIDGTLVSSDETKIENEKQGIENWDTIFKPGDINENGIDYYIANKNCPPYTIFVDRVGQFDFAVFTEKYLKDFESYGKSKQGYAIMPLVSSSRPPATDGDDKKHEGSSCKDYTSKPSCEHNNSFACIWNETEYGNYCNTDTLKYVRCGDAFDIPYQAPGIISLAVNLLKIAAPIILIITSIISLLKGMSAANEDEIKKAQKGLIRKVIAAVMVFFVISIVQFVIMKAADSGETKNLSTCLSCLLNNDCENNVYFKTNVLGEYKCTYLNDLDSSFDCK